MLQAEPVSANGRLFAELASEGRSQVWHGRTLWQLSAPAMLFVLAAVIIADFTFQMTNSRTPLLRHLYGRVAALPEGARRDFNGRFQIGGC